MCRKALRLFCVNERLVRRGSFVYRPLSLYELDNRPWDRSHVNRAFSMARPSIDSDGIRIEKYNHRSVLLQGNGRGNRLNAFAWNRNFALIINQQAWEIYNGSCESAINRTYRVLAVVNENCQKCSVKSTRLNCRVAIAYDNLFGSIYELAVWRRLWFIHVNKIAIIYVAPEKIIWMCHLKQTTFVNVYQEWNHIK